MGQDVIRQILPTTIDFKAFWKGNGPFAYALTSREFPPVLLEPEEWLFSDDLTALLKELMQWRQNKIKIVQAPFNPGKKDVLKPGDLIPWRINNFPDEWESAVCTSFTPKGYLTESVLLKSVSEKKEDIEQAFFTSLAEDISRIGYCLLKPAANQGSGKAACINDYLREWEEDEQF
ncbi:MAG: hypothetical protein R6U68_05190 [Desulfobacteraceae bacterium]